MYRIEVAPGEETVFRTIEELAIGIRNGVITPRARIFHQASQKWLPIGLHPHYKKALEMPAASASPAPVTTATPVPTPSRPKSHTPHPPTPSHAHSPARPPEPMPIPAPPPAAPKATEPKLAPKVSAPEKLPAPRTSPVVAMQQEVLRDLPVLLIPEPEPLPWQMPAPQVSERAEPPHRHTTQPSAARPPVGHTPIAPHPFGQARIAPQPPPHEPVARPATHEPTPHHPVPHQPVAHRSVTQHRPWTAHEPAAPATARVALRSPGVATERAEPEADEVMLPRPTARRSQRMGGRPVILLGAAAALVIGTHFILTETPSASADAVASPAPVAERERIETAPEPSRSSVELPAAETRTAERVPGAGRAPEPRVTTAPARVAMTPGPAFAGSVPARPGADSMVAARARAFAPAPVPATPTESLSIAPPPVAIDLGLADIPPDSLVGPRRTGDTLAMKKILRAINGGKAAEASPAQ
jgi:hypothetical protein